MLVLHIQVEPFHLCLNLLFALFFLQTCSLLQTLSLLQQLKLKEHESNSSNYPTIKCLISQTLHIPYNF